MSNILKSKINTYRAKQIKDSVGTQIQTPFSVHLNNVPASFQPLRGTEKVILGKKVSDDLAQIYCQGNPDIVMGDLISLVGNSINKLYEIIDVGNMDSLSKFTRILVQRSLTNYTFEE